MRLDLRSIGNGKRSVKADSGQDGLSLNSASRSICEWRYTLLITLFHRLVCFTLTVAMDGISLWCLFTVFIVLNGIVSTGRRKKDTDLKVDFISERGCENAPHTIP